MTQITQIQADPTAFAIGKRVDTPLAVVVYDSLAAVEGTWRALESCAVLTPYQRFDWIAGLLASGAERRGRIAIAVVSSPAGSPLAILPLLIGRRRGLVRARMLGANQSNSDWILCAPHFRPSLTDLRSIFDQIARAAGGIDVLTLSNQPARLQGMANPLLALRHAPGPSNLYVLSLAGAATPYIEHHLTTKRRSNISRGRRRLEEMLGPVRLIRVNDLATLERVHAVFLEQRGARFKAMGVDNIFAQAPFPNFFRELAIASFGQKRPAMVVHALQAGDEIVATSWGATATDHYSQYINSTSTGPANRYSLSGILMADLLDELIGAGIETFDMGLGDFDYKIEWTEPQPVFDSVIPLTIPGFVVADMAQRRGAIKRFIKQTPVLWTVAKAARRFLYQFRRP